MFYVHRQMDDGHLGKCKDCTKSDVSKNRLKNIDKIRAYDRERGKLPRRKRANDEYNRKRKLIYPERFQARNKVGNAIRDGKLERPDKCSSCDKKGKVVGHHHDYKKPLDVVWLCQPCHKQVHKDTF